MEKDAKPWLTISTSPQLMPPADSTATAKDCCSPTMANCSSASATHAIKPGKPTWWRSKGFRKQNKSHACSRGQAQGWSHSAGKSTRYRRSGQHVATRSTCAFSKIDPHQLAGNQDREGTQSPAKTHDRGGRPADIATDPHAGWRVAREKMSFMTRQLETESCKIPKLP